jgi:hypothetical protein|tara:strand:- start:201 stop:752 length:552 start_codon:yes stop_codon:yes gene_type:complete
MVKINSGFHNIAWEFLLSCLQVKINGGYISDSEKQIIVASPWISDLSNQNLRLNTPLYNGVQMKIRRRLSSLSNVLITLVEEGFEVVVVTSKPGCSKWKKDWYGLQLERDRNLQELWSSKGIKVFHDISSHVKSISTPVGIIDGSANMTDNGFFKNTEHMEVTEFNDSGFIQARHVVQQLVPN